MVFEGREAAERIQAQRIAYEVSKIFGDSDGDDGGYEEIEEAQEREADRRARAFFGELKQALRTAEDVSDLEAGEVLE